MRVLVLYARPLRGCGRPLLHCLNAGINCARLERVAHPHAHAHRYPHTHTPTRTYEALNTPCRIVSFSGIQCAGPGLGQTLTAQTRNATVRGKRQGATWRRPSTGTPAPAAARGGGGGLACFTPVSK